jgi:heme/copper-type cytochrome/quinol oxidase subunit 2
MVVMMWWMMILCWYLVFGIFLIPYRMVRRGSRKRKVQDRQHKEMLEAIRQNGNQK